MTARSPQPAARPATASRGTITIGTPSPPVGTRLYQKPGLAVRSTPHLSDLLGRIGCEGTVTAAILRFGYGKTRASAIDECGGMHYPNRSCSHRPPAETNEEGKPTVANVNVTYGEMQGAANQL